MIPGQIVFDPAYLARLQEKKKAIADMCNCLNALLLENFVSKEGICNDFTDSLCDFLTSDIDGVLAMAAEAAAQSKPTGNVN